MHNDITLLEARISRFLHGRLAPRRIRNEAAVRLARWDVHGEPRPIADALVADYHPASIGEPWGSAWNTTWIRVDGRIPAAWSSELTELQVDLGFDQGRPGFQAEGLVVASDGTIVKGINPRNQYVRVPAQDDGSFTLYIEAAANPDNERLDFSPISTGDRGANPSPPLYSLRSIRLIERDEEVEALFHDIDVLSQLALTLPADSTRRHTVLRGIEAAINAIGARDISEAASEARARVVGLLQKPANASAHSMTLIGHAHIDSAWLWPVRETVRKCARTFSNALSLMDADPDFMFGASSAQQYAWVKESYPELFERVRARVAEGRFVPLGQSWVEFDTNLPSGESLVRQFTEGAAFFRDEFGIEPEELWLPDSFGYTGALPQIATQAGMKWMSAQKLSWNDSNPMPHHTFLWEGFDGTRLFTHFPPIDTYLSDLSAADLAHAEANHREKGRSDVSIAPFGYGDGGGGPTPEMLERARRLRSLEGSPKLEYGAPSTFFAHAERDYADPPVWAGEMYLQFHRGVYTSQARIKRGNRLAERLLHEVELWSAVATIRTGRAYPYGELKRMWRTLLLLQFHDILPGSSIAWVNRDALADFASIHRESERLISDAIAALVGPGENLMLVNSASTRSAGIEAFSIGEPAHSEDTRLERDGDCWILSNTHLTAQINECGEIISLVDHVSGRDAIPPGGAANILELHADTPTAFDAWNLEEHHRHQRSRVRQIATPAEALGGNAVRVVLTAGTSIVERILRLTARSHAIEVEHAVDWRETDQLLAVVNQFDLRAEHSTAETQFGHVNRPIHANTSWEHARYEVCAHRYVRVAEPEYGVAVANDASYGHAFTRWTRADGGTTTTVELSLLRATQYPDPGRDHGDHRFRTTLRPNATLEDAVSAGYSLNAPARPVTGGQSVPPIVSSSSLAVPIETVKLADDGSGDVIVRLYEATGRRASTTFRASFAVAAIDRVDLHERSIAGGELPANDEIDLVLRPFELVTLRVSRAV